MISILSVNWNCLDWMQLLVQSVRKFTTVPYEMVIVDNNSQDGSVEWLGKQNDVRAILLDQNIGHGAGLDLGLQHVKYPCCLVLDIDAHLMKKHWDFDLLDILSKNAQCKLIAAKGGEPKPIHPCFMFFPVAFFRQHKFSFKHTKEYDVGRKLYPDILNLGYEVFRVGIGYEKAPNGKYYEGAFGDVYYLNQQCLIYHNWYSARMWQKEKVDNLTKDEFERGKKIVFGQELVQKILAE